MTNTILENMLNSILYFIENEQTTTAKETLKHLINEIHKQNTEQMPEHLPIWDELP